MQKCSNENLKTTKVRCVFCMHEWPHKPWNCTHWLLGLSWPVVVWGCSCGALRLSGSFLSAGGSATYERAFLRQVDVWWDQAGTVAVGMVTDWRPRPWCGANPWAAEMSQAWLKVHCRHIQRSEAKQSERQQLVGLLSWCIHLKITVCTLYAPLSKQCENRTRLCGEV